MFTRRTVVSVLLLGLAATPGAFAGHSVLVSKGPNGQATASVSVTGISADGSRVVFMTTANNLAPSDLETKQDAFVFDQNTQTTLHVSIDDPLHPMSPNSFVAESTISADGSTVFFTSAAPSDLYVHDLATGVTKRIVSGGGFGSSLTLGGCSADGTRVVFTASIAGLDPLDPTTDQDVYVYDTVANSVALVNKDANGQTLPGPAYLSRISGDGRYVVFLSPAPYAPGVAGGDNLFRKDLLTGAVVVVHPLKSSTLLPPPLAYGVSTDGSKVLLTSPDPTWAVGDTNGDRDVFLWDVATSTIELVSRNAAGVVGNLSSTSAAMSGDANWVAWTTGSTNLVPGDSGTTQRVIVKDRAGNRLHSCAVTNSGAFPNGSANGPPFVSSDGCAVAFASTSTNIVVGDSTLAADAYVHRMRSFHDLGYGVAGVGGIPQLVGTGTLDVGDPFGIALSQAASNAPMMFCVSLAQTPVFTFGGTFVALPLAVSFIVATDAAGSFGFTVPTPGPQLPNLYMQVLVADPSAPEGVSMSNAIVGAAF